MDNQELKRAAELAGMKCYQYSNPMLPAYVASLLVAKVRISGKHYKLFELLAKTVGDRYPMCVATDEQRIRAAVAVLEEGE